MSSYRLCVIGGWCGNRMIMVAEHLETVLSQEGFSCRVSTHSIWENYSTPPEGDLILQLLPAYSPSETSIPLINIRPLLLNLDDEATIAAILEAVTRVTEGSANGVLQGH